MSMEAYAEINWVHLCLCALWSREAPCSTDFPFPIYKQQQHPERRRKGVLGFPDAAVGESWEHCHYATGSTVVWFLSSGWMGKREGSVPGSCLDLPLRYMEDASLLFQEFIEENLYGQVWHAPPAFNPEKNTLVLVSTSNRETLILGVHLKSSPKNQWVKWPKIHWDANLIFQCQLI